MVALEVAQQENTLALKGELVIETVPIVEKQNQGLIASLSNFEQANISFEHVSKVDTAGLAWLLNFAAALRKSGIKVNVQQPPEALIKLSRLSNAESLIFDEKE